MVSQLRKSQSTSAELVALRSHYLRKAEAEMQGRPALEAARDAAVLDPAAHEGAAFKVKASADREATLRRMATDLEPQIAAARERERFAKDEADLADFERRTRRAAQRRQTQYERLAGELGEMAREMAAERHEARVLRSRGLRAQEAISYPVVDYLHLPAWDRGQAELYCPAGADRLALREAFHGRRPSQAPRFIVAAEGEDGE